jgi:hypothetical protein
MAFQQSKKKKTPVIPEPSPRFILWSAMVAFFLLAGVLVFDYATGQWPGNVTADNAENHK